MAPLSSQPRLLVSTVIAMSLLLSTLALVVCAFFGEVCFAQNDTFITTLLSGLDQLGMTNFTGVVRQVQADTTQPTFFLSLSDSSTPKTLFIPINEACKFQFMPVIKSRVDASIQSSNRMRTFSATRTRQTTQDFSPPSCYTTFFLELGHQAI